MKLIKQISTGRTVHREDPHSDQSIHNASLFTKIALEDLQVVDDEITEDQFATRSNDELPPLDRIRHLEQTLTSRRIRDALANDAGKKFITDVEALIQLERDKL